MEDVNVAAYPLPETMPAVRVKPLAAGRLALMKGEERTGVNVPILGYLVEARDALVVVDCGLSSRWRGEVETHIAPDDSPAPGTRYQPELDGPALAEQLETLNLRPDRLLCTHLHLDHAGGATELGLTLEASQAELERLPRADADALGIPVRDLAGIATQPIELRDRPLGPFVRSAEIVPGLIAVDTAGHTPGSISFFCCLGAPNRSGVDRQRWGTWALVCGDAVYPKLDEPDSPAFHGMLRIRRMLEDWPGMAVLAGHDPGVLRAAAGGWLGAI
jgi:glyoxylase-like metal-dependent hydrolase (beta-lactamase superfamily II)